MRQVELLQKLLQAPAFRDPGRGELQDRFEAVGLFDPLQVAIRAISPSRAGSSLMAMTLLKTGRDSG